MPGGAERTVRDSSSGSSGGLCIRSGSTVEREGSGLTLRLAVLTPPVCSPLSRMLMLPPLLSLQGDTPRESTTSPGNRWSVGGMGKGAASATLMPPALNHHLHQPRPKLSALPSGSHLCAVRMLMPPRLLSLQGDTPRESTTSPGSRW
ncbi:unnamed protein product [Closterium sp. Naga37s-1]|nr:unnamed protein product [Closterium sp. Naga37s-1]